METGNTPRAGGSDRSSERRGSTHVAAIAGSVILVGLVAFSLYRRSLPSAEAGSTGPVVEGTLEGSDGTLIKSVVPVVLSPEASIIVERYRCICSCDDPLSICTCKQTPGSIDMKAHLQELVDQKKSVEEIDKAMVEKYGQEVMLSQPAEGNPDAPAG